MAATGMRRPSGPSSTCGPHARWCSSRDCRWGALALRLAEHHPDDVAGLVLVNPALHGNPQLALVPWAKHLIRTTNSIGSSIRKADVTEHAYPAPRWRPCMP